LNWNRLNEICCDYNCVQLALGWLLQGPEELNRDSCLCQQIPIRASCFKTPMYQRKKKLWGGNFLPPAWQKFCHEKTWTGISVALSWHWSLASEQEEHLYRGAVGAPRIRWSSPEGCGILSALWSVILGPQPLPPRRLRGVTTCKLQQSSGYDGQVLSAGNKTWKKDSAQLGLLSKPDSPFYPELCSHETILDVGFTLTGSTRCQWRKTNGIDISLSHWRRSWSPFTMDARGTVVLTSLCGRYI